MAGRIWAACLFFVAAYVAYLWVLVLTGHAK